MKSIIITGSAGFIGGHLLKYILDNTNWYIYCILRKKIITKSSRITNVYWELGKNNYKGFLKADYLIHLASHICYSDDNSINTFEKLIKTNVIGLLDLFQNTKVKSAIILSSVSIYGRNNLVPAKEDNLKKPSNLYGLSKLFQFLLSNYIKDFILDKSIFIKTIIVPSIYGKGQYGKTVLPIFLQHALGNTTISILGKGQRSQDYLYVKDLTRILTELVQQNFSGVYNLGSGKETTLLELAKTIIDAVNSKSKIFFKEGKFDKSRLLLDTSALRRKYNYKIEFNLSQGIKDYIKDLGILNE